MRLEDAPARFRALLRESGADPGAPEPALAWAAFRRFAGETIDGLDPALDEDLLLFEVGPGDEAATLAVDVERQYGPEGGMRSILLSLTYDAGALPGVRAVQLWGRPGAGADTWAAEVEASEPFALLRLPPAGVTVSTGRI